MPDNDPTFGLEVFGPIDLSWNSERQELDLGGRMMAGLEAKPFRLQLSGEAAIQALRLFRKLLAHVDEERVASATRHGLQ
ncbi:hypothetical protein [Paracoccus thiocyanatus]|uniref:hypothetical protein n=1 Tax=Paracoccus thiocyanatus TaxID=34006 RepID=UPI00122C6D3B|nr:hypothetical protein [Paracoccus thiocyanatus]